MSKKLTNGLIILLLIIIVGILSYVFLFSDKTIYVQSIQLNKNSIKLIVGSSEKLEVNIIPEDATDKSVVWESENKDVAIVSDDGLVTAKGEGNTFIDVKTLDGDIGSKCFISVEKKKVESIEIDKTSLSLLVGEKEHLSITITPEELSDDIVTWSSSDYNIVSVNDLGEIEAIKKGEATVIVTSSDGNKTASCLVNVSEPIVNVTGVSLDNKEVVLVSGATLYLTATVEPDNATDKTLVWNSSNPSVATVNEDGKVVVNGNGTAEIIVRTIDGNKEAKCNIRSVSIKTFDQRNDAIVEYMNNPSAKTAQSVYRKYKDKTSCSKPKKYTSSITGNIKIYRYDETNYTREYIETSSASNINYYMAPGSTYYLESATNPGQIEVVKITGNVRMISDSVVGNFRDLGGWKADGGTVKYGILFRSNQLDNLKNLTMINALGINRVIDLRSQYKKDSVIANIRRVIPIEAYSIIEKSNVRKVISEIMKDIVNNEKVLFHCAIGRDRTGTIAYILEGLLGVSSTDRGTDYELSYFAGLSKTRTDASFQNLIKRVDAYEKTTYEQEKFINWYLSGSSNKASDLELINNFRKKAINGTPHIYKLSGNKLVLE